jgi:hypothetical protein
MVSLRDEEFLSVKNQVLRERIFFSEEQQYKENKLRDTTVYRDDECLSLSHEISLLERELAEVKSQRHE